VTTAGSRQTSDGLSFQAPAELLSAEFVHVEVSATSERYPSWATPVTVRFRRSAQGWTLVGLLRGPDLPDSGTRP
jgi:hypothetical protein